MLYHNNKNVYFTNNRNISLKNLMDNTNIIYVYSLDQAKNDLESFSGKRVMLVNAPGSIWYLGIKVIHNIFTNLKKSNFPIEDVIINAEDDVPAVISALKLGYTKIIYSGKSQAINKLLEL